MHFVMRWTNIKAQLCVCLHEAFVSTRGCLTQKKNTYITSPMLRSSTFACWCVVDWSDIVIVDDCPRFDIVAPHPVRVSSGADNALHIIASLIPPFSPLQCFYTYAILTQCTSTLYLYTTERNLPAIEVAQKQTICLVHFPSSLPKVVTSPSLHPFLYTPPHENHSR